MAEAAPSPFVCPLCELVSYHPRDKAERYCAFCGFVDDIAAMRRLTAPAPPRELGTPIRGFDRHRLAVLVDVYGEEAVRRAIDDILASQRARARG